MRTTWKIAAHCLQTTEVNFRKDNPFAPGCRCDHLSPRIDDQRMSPHFRTAFDRAGLCRGHHPALVFNRPRAEQGLPMRLARGRREGRRYEQNFRSLDKKSAVDLWETKIVTNGEPKSPYFGLYADDIGAGLHAFRFPFLDTTRQIDVEEMDLSIDTEPLAARPKNDTRIEGERPRYTGVLEDRTGDQRNTHFPGDTGKSGERRTIDRLGGRTMLRLRPAPQEDLGKSDEPGTLAGSVANQIFRDTEIPGLIGHDAHLDARRQARRETGRRHALGLAPARQARNIGPERDPGRYLLVPARGKSEAGRRGKNGLSNSPRVGRIATGEHLGTKTGDERATLGLRCGFARSRPDKVGTQRLARGGAALQQGPVQK